MRSLTTNPAVIDLVKARRSAPLTRVLHLAVPGVEGLLVDALSRSVAPGVRVQRRTVVATPVGSLHVPLVLAGPGRRVAVIPDDATTADAAGDAAALLVFGVFDAVYRVRRQALVCAVPATAWEIARQELTLFDSESRDALRLCAIPRPLAGRTAASDRDPMRHAPAPAVRDVRVMRLKHPADWAEAFEQAMRTVEASRLPLFARSA